MNLSVFRSWPKARLAEALASGHPVAASDLAGWLYQGVSLGLPRWLERLTWSVFVKGFAADGAAVRGWNVRIRQGDDRLLDAGAALHAEVRRGAPFVFGHFHAVSVEVWRASGRPARGLPAHGLMLDYRHAANPRLDPTRLVRDPLVALQAGDPTLLLGRSMVEFADRLWGTPSYFVLRRWRKVDGPGL